MNTQDMADAVKREYEKLFLRSYHSVSLSTASYMPTIADTGGLGYYEYREHPLSYTYEPEEDEVDFIYCENCGCIIPDEYLEKVGNCNHCGAPPPKGLKHVR